MQSECLLCGRERARERRHLCNYCNEVQNPLDFKLKMEKIFRINDVESAHIAADELMCELLKDLGYRKGIEVFEDENRWCS